MRERWIDAARGFLLISPTSSQKFFTVLELVNVTGSRRAAEESGADPNTDARTLTAEIRYRF